MRPGPSDGYKYPLDIGITLAQRHVNKLQPRCWMARESFLSPCLLSIHFPGVCIGKDVAPLTEPRLPAADTETSVTAQTGSQDVSFFSNGCKCPSQRGIS